MDNWRDKEETRQASMFWNECNEEEQTRRRFLVLHADRPWAKMELDGKPADWLPPVEKAKPELVKETPTREPTAEELANLTEAELNERTPF